jgi:Ulp1 family protease
MCLNENHWAVVHVNRKSQQVLYYDSIMENKSVLPLFKNFFNHSNMKKYRFNTFEYVFPNCQPSQANGTDCGLYMLKTMQSLIDGEPLDYDQADIDLFRDQVYVKLKNQMSENDITLQKDKTNIHYDITEYGNSQFEMY